MLPSQTGPGGASDPPDPVTALSTELIRHARLLHVMKSHVASGAPQGLDGAAVGLLMQLVRCGPSRQGELADVAMLDPSTVSRYVGQLVRHGYAERRPDPVDGRAVLLVASDRGRATADGLVARRNEAFREVLTGWDENDVRTLTTLVARLNDDVEARRHTLARTASPDAGSALQLEEN